MNNVSDHTLGKINANEKSLEKESTQKMKGGSLLLLGHSLSDKTREIYKYIDIS